MRIVGNLRVPTGHSRDILLQAKGITGIESTQIRWFSRRSGGGGWSGRAWLSGGQESQTRAKVLSNCHPSGQQLRQPDGKAKGQIKDYSHDSL